MRRLIPVLCLLVLSACVNYEELAAQEAAADDRQCIDLGFEPGTEGYGNCRLKLLEIRAIEDQAIAVEQASLRGPMWYNYGWWCE